MERLRRSGFTLVEIAVVLFILALLTAGGLGLVAGLRTAANQKSTIQNADIIKTALQGFVSRNGRLPCPALEADTPSAATFGIEAPTAGTCTGATALGTTGMKGVVPWKTLGLSFDAALDGWGNQFTYAVTLSATNLNSQTLAGMRGVLTVHTDAPATLGLPATGNQINGCTTTAGDNSCNAFAAVVLVSHGANLLGARTREGVAAPAAASTREVENTDADTVFVNREVTDSGVNVFDDVVFAYTPNDLLSLLYAQGMKNEQTSLAEKQRQIMHALVAISVSTRTGTSGAYVYPLPPPTGVASAFTFAGADFTNCLPGPAPTTLASLPTALQTLRDPWGNAFGYQISETSMNSADSCVNPIIIVSGGPNGVIGTGGDDLIYYVSGPEYKAALTPSGW
jgi:prepilin-type N-terminal cleavage/methylation domain-containing protein